MSDAIHVYFYVGHYGSTIRFSLHHADQARLMRQLFDQLARAASSYRLSRDAHFLLHDITDVVLATVDVQPEQTVRLTSDLIAEWAETKRRWNHHAALVKVLEKSAKPGHQYLTSGPGEVLGEGIMVIVSFKEPSNMEVDATGEA